MSARLALSYASAFIAFALLSPLGANAAPTCTLVANPAVVVPGQGFTLSLISTGATSATINNGIGTIQPNGSRQSISISQTTTYMATVSGSTGTTTCSTSVIVDQSMSHDPSQGGSSGGRGGGGGMDPSKILQGLGQALGGLGQLQNALGGNNAQNLACQPAGNPDCGCMQRMTNDGCRPDPSDKWHCPCQNTTNQGVSVGICQAGQCLGQSTQMGGNSPLAGGAQGLGQGLQALGSILQGLSSLMGGGGGGGGGGGDYGGSYNYPQGCTQYYYTATSTSDPCAIYQPNLVSGSLYTGTSELGGTSGLLDIPISTGSTQTPISSLLNTIGSGSSVTPGGANQQGTRQEGSSPEDSLSGDVRDATVLANLRRGFSEVAGFFGGDTLSRVCRTRPWAGSSFLAGVAPDTFFDELCKKAGYTEEFFSGGGTQQPSTSFGSGTAPIPTTGTTTNVIEPKAEIRAEPASVRLGTRTYIFWTSEGVNSCAVTGPSFTQNTLFGAGATVPITGPTSFVINCTAPDGTVVSDSVTVNLAI